VKDLLLVGSIPLETAIDVFEIFGAQLGAHLDSLPDSEVGMWRHWVNRLHFEVFALPREAALGYLGMVHNMRRFAARLATARRYLRDFGVAPTAASGGCRTKSCRACSRSTRTRSAPSSPSR